MKARIVWPASILDILCDLPEREREIILEKIEPLRSFPEMYPVRGEGRFRAYRWFLAENWLVYYRRLGNTVYIRALWPARIP